MAHLLRLCPLPHNTTDGRPKLQVFGLSPSTNPRPLLDLLAVTDQELQDQMAKGHPYAFNMGNNISYQNYEEAVKALMERNMPDLVLDKQTEVVLLPETHLPKVPRAVDFQSYQTKQKSFGTQMFSFLGLKSGSEDVTNAKGDLAERELAEELQNFFAKHANKNFVVLQGSAFRVPGKGKGAIEEHDFVIIDKENKLVICIECKVTLTGSTGRSAVEQTNKLQSLLEEYFASEFTSGQWCFVGMIFTERINIKHKQLICRACSPFIIEGTSQLATKLNGLWAQVQKMRPQPVVPSHAEYVSLVQGLAFVVLSQPISNYCTIASAVHDKVVGKPAEGVAKEKSGQGDLKSILFWTNDQAKIMFGDQLYVFFNGPWSTGKTLLMKEKSVMWARQNPTKPLYFVVARAESAKRTSLLEIDLKYFFHQQHSLQNVEVFGLPTRQNDTLSRLYQEATTRSPGSWMVDELIMPKPKDHKEWGKELQKLQTHLATQPEKPLLWIVCSGIDEGKAEHFGRDYLENLLPPDFHQPHMAMPLRNTKRILEFAKLEANKGVKDLYNANKANPVYNIPPHLIDGVPCSNFLFNDKNDLEEITSVVEAACREVLGRTGGAGFPVLCDGWKDSQINSVKRGVEKAGAKALVYVCKVYAKSCAEAEVEEWLRRRRSREEERCLITDEYVSRGWEASHLLAVAFYSTGGWENLVMRTVGYCALVKMK